MQVITYSVTQITITNIGLYTSFLPSSFSDVQEAVPSGVAQITESHRLSNGPLPPPGPSRVSPYRGGEGGNAPSRF